MSEDGDRVLTAHKSFGAGVHVLKAQIRWSPEAGEEIEVSDEAEIEAAA